MRFSSSSWFGCDFPSGTRIPPVFWWYPVLSFPVNDLWVPYRRPCWRCPFQSLPFPASTAAPQPPKPTSHNFGISFPAQHWPDECFLEICHYPKRKRLQEIWKWYLTDCRLRRKCSWLQTPCLEGSIVKFQVKGQTVWVSQPRRVWGPCGTSVTANGCHTCCILAQFESQLPS